MPSRSSPCTIKDCLEFREVLPHALSHFWVLLCCCCFIVVIVVVFRAEIDSDNPQMQHEQEARRLYEGMLQALQDVSELYWQGQEADDTSHHAHANTCTHTIP